jgi:hypothetical protein
MPRSAKTLAVAALWMVVAVAAAFAGSAAAVLACLRDTHELWLAELVTLVLVPSVSLYFLLDWWRPESRVRQVGFLLPLVAGVCLLLALVDVWPPLLDGPVIEKYAVALAGAIGAVGLTIRARRQLAGGERGQSPFVRSTLWAVPANGDCPLSPPAAPDVRRFQFGLSLLFVITTLVAVFCACLKTFGTTLGLVACGWAVAVVLLMIAVQGADKSPRRGWPTACLLAATALYGPLVLMTAHTWLSNPCDHYRWMWLKFLWVMPGGIIEVLVLRNFHGLPPAVTLAIAGVLSLAIVAATAWLAKRTGRARWVALAIVACLAVWSAAAADALIRA